jgi:hypothetical protein
VIEGLIRDDLDGAANQTRLREIRDAVAATCEGTIPFLLLPVRIETRFMQVERTAGPRDDLHEGLSEIRERFAAIASRQLATRLGGRPRGVVVAGERALYAGLEGDIAALTQKIEALADAARNSTDVSALPALESLVDAVPAAATGAATHAQTLRSRFKGDVYGARLRAVRDQLLAPLVDRVRDEVLPKLRLLAALRANGRRDPTRHAVSNRDLTRSARGLQLIATTIESCTTALAQPLGAPAERAAQIIAVGERVAGDARRLVTQTREVSLIADAMRRDLSAAGQRLVTAFAPWRERLANLAAAGGAGGARAAVASEHAAAHLETLVVALRFDGRIDTLPVDAVPTTTADELWVRIYPDDIAVHSHESALTEREVANARTFWEATHAATTDPTRREAWRVLATRHGVRRAAYLAEIMRPGAPPASGAPPVIATLVTLDRRLAEIAASPGWFDRDPGRRFGRATAAARAVLAAVIGAHPTAAEHERARGLVRVIRGRVGELAGRFERRDGHIEDAQRHRAALDDLVRTVDRVSATMDALVVATSSELVGDLVFPTVETRAASWSAAPHCRVMPQRFVAVTVRDSQVTHAVVGEPIEELVVGPDPTSNQPMFELVDGEFVVTPALRWMTDFQAAISLGMAVRIPISAAEARDGFDELFVLGVRVDSASNGKQLVEDMLANHHFNEQGLAFTPIGTPTNNTDGRPAGYRAADDIDRAYEIERGAPLFDATEAGDDARDGLRFAAALGISPVTVQHVTGADGSDGARAGLVNRALWPATLGTYSEEMIGTLMSADSARRLEAFFTAHVSARGMLTTIRVGAQPYGLLTTTAISRFVPSGGLTLPPMPAGPEALPEAERARRFDALLAELLSNMHADWTRVRRAKVACVRPGSDDPQRDFVDILGLQAVSVGAAYRFALNVANRHPGVADGDGVRFGFSTQGPLGALDRLQQFFAHAFALPMTVLVGANGLVSPIFAKLYERIANDRVYDVRVLSETRAMVGPVAGDPTTFLAALVAAPARELVEDGIRGEATSPALLYLLARQALLVQLRRAALDIAEVEGMLTPDARAFAGSADEFVVRNLLGDDHVTKWSYLFAPPPRLDGRFEIVFPNGPGTLFTHLGNRPLADYLARRGDNPLYAGFSGPRKPAHDIARARLDAHARDVEALAAIPAAALDQLVREHLDLASHRLDAWRLGLANQRLVELRATAPAGVYLGGFGWVEDLRPGGARVLADDLPPALDTGEPVYADADDQGFVHTPSLSHAVTAAILRSGYLTERAAAEPSSRFAINISSRRVRTALELLDGIEAGHELGALLGYRFERELHEAYDATTSYDDLIPGFRAAFPATGAVDPDNPAPERASRLVTDGTALLATVRSWIEAHVPLAARSGRTIEEILGAGGAYTDYPWGIVGSHGQRVLPQTPAENPSDGRRLSTVVRAIDRLADAIDAIADLAVAEGIFQIVRGNFPRASAVLAAVAEGRPIARPQIVQTPRSGTAVVQRVLLPLRRIDGRALDGSAMPPGWEAAPITPRAAAEPGINHWIGELVGSAGTIMVRYADPVDPPGTLRSLPISELGLQPIDLLALIGPGLDNAESELAARVALHVLPPTLDLSAALTAGTLPPIEMRFVDRDPAWGPEIRSVFEVAAALTAAHELVRARPATANDLVVDETVTTAPTGDGVDAAELAARAGVARDRVRAVAVELMTVLDGGTWSGVEPTGVVASEYAETRRTALDTDPGAIVARYRELAALGLRAAALGVRVALPPVRLQSIEQVASAMTAAIANGFVQLAGRLARATGATSLDAVRELLGRGFPVVPHFEPRDPIGIRDQLASTTLLRHAGPFAPAAFLDAAAAVREPLRHLARLEAIADAFGAALPQPAVAQLPPQLDDYWLGARVPPGTELDGDRLSLLVLAPDRWQLGAAPVAALVIDQWTDVIPDAIVTTGVAMHYDQPDAMPPQAMLLAVPPVIAPRWNWDDLVHTLHDTLELARNRTVELEQLSDEIYGQLLPAVVGELVPERLGGIDISGDRVILDFGVNNEA